MSDAHWIRKQRERQPIVDHYAGYNFAKPEDVAIPATKGPPFEALGEPELAYECDDCGHISISYKAIRGHCNKQHQWRFGEDTPTNWTEVKVQSFFEGFNQKYFIVEKKSNLTEKDKDLPKDDQDDLAQLLLEFSEGRKEDAEKLAVVEKELEKSDNTGWWNLVQWHNHFGECNIKRIAHVSRMPDRQEPHLKQAVSVVNTLINGAVKGLSSLHDDTPFWLRTANSTNKIENRPMVQLQNVESLDRYVGYWARFICYCLRIAEVKGLVGGDSASDEANAADENVAQLRDSLQLLKFNAEQEQRLRDMWESLLAKENENIQILKIKALSVSFILQSVKGVDHFDSPLVHFAAVLGIDEEGIRLRKGEECSFILAGYLYCIRVLFVEHTLPAATRAEQTDVDIDRFLELRGKFLIAGAYCPTGFIIRWLGYGKTISMQSGNSPSVTWSRSGEGDVLYFHGKPLAMSRFRGAIYDMIRDAEDILWRDLMWSDDWERFEIDLDSISDDLSSVQRSESFVTREVNRLRDKVEWMAERMMRAKKSRRLRVNQQWRMTKVREYGHRIRDFLELLMVLIHICSGQPARGEEITPIRHRNGLLQERNIFVIDGQVMFVTRYHKSQALFGRPKVIPRFMPWRIGQLVAIYLAYVQGFKEDLDQQTNGPRRSDHMFYDKHGSWSTEHLTKVLHRETAIRMELKLGTLDYRHVAISIGRKYIGPGFMRELKISDAMEEEGTDVIGEQIETAFNLQSAHQGSAAMRYGVRGDIIHSLTEESLLVFGELSDKLHQFFGLHSRRPQITKHVRGPSDGMQLVLSPKKVRSSAASGTEGSMKSEIMSSPMPLMVVPAWMSTHSPNTGVLDISRVPNYTEGEVTQALQKALGTDNVTYRSAEQERALQAVLNHESPVVVVLPTGGGKSLTFMGPACLPQAGVTIVVAPFRALESNIISRCEEKGIECLKWTFGEHRFASVVVVSADRAASEQFITYASRLNDPKRKLLRRVVIDECHLTYSASNYRVRLNHLCHLRVLNCPTILLTATLPPVSVPELMDVMRIGHPVIIRACTARVNIQYMVQRCSTGHHVMVACEMAQRRRIGLKRGIFYCKSRDLAEELAIALRAAGFDDSRHYHSTSEAKDEAIATWLAAGGFITATGALGTGVDFPGIVYIVHVGVPYGMIDFAQESGRGGRNGEAVTSIVLLEERESTRLEKMDAAAMTTDEFFMRQFIQGKECRRLALGQYLDGMAKTCSDLGGLQCDRCGEGIVDWHHGEKKEAVEVRAFEQMLDEAQRHCGFCWVLEGADKAEHRSDRCPGERAEVSIAHSERLRGLIRVHKHCRVCWRCGISQRICDGAEKKRSCRWNGVAAVLWLAWYHSGTAIEEGGFRGSDLEEYARWLGFRAEEKIQGVVVSNGMRMLWTQAQRRQARGISRLRGFEEKEKTIEVVQESVEETNMVGGTGDGVVMDRRDRRDRIIAWLSKHCIYCEITGRFYNSAQHWHKTCRKSQAMADGCEYDSTLRWQAEMDELRNGQCWSCKEVIDHCGVRDSMVITCEYGDIMVPVIYLLYQRGWLEKWMNQKGYIVGAEIVHLQRWLSEDRRKGGSKRSRVVEAFEAYAMEFDRA